jgi:uncharacterized protein YciI
MAQIWQGPLEIRFVSSETVPEKLFVCSARIKTQYGKLLRHVFGSSTGVFEKSNADYAEHLAYSHHLGDKYYQAGPSVDFTEILHIFATNSIEEAQTLMHNDPCYQKGIFYQDSWFPWEIHSPYWKTPAYFFEADRSLQISAGVKPKFPPDIDIPIEEVKIDISTPNKLFACFSKMNREILKPWLSPESRTRSAILIQHIYNCASQGGAGPMGYHWLSGPSVDYTQDLTIFSVNSLQMAQMIKENDAFSRYGIFSDLRYFEWCVHVPFRKASPQHRAILLRFLNSAGVKIAEE